MQAVGPEPVGHHAAGGFIDDLHFAIAHDIMFVAQHQMQGGESLGDQFLAMHGIAPGAAEFAAQRLEPLHGVRRERNRAIRFPDQIVARSLKAARQFKGLCIDVGLLLDRRFLRQDQRRAGFVDQDAISLIDDGVMQAAQHDALGRLVSTGDAVHLEAQVAAPRAERDHVAQIVESDFLVGAVGDVAGIGGSAFVRLHALHDAADRQAEKAVERTECLDVALGEIVVHGEDMYRRAFESGGDGGERHCQRFAFAGPHLADHAAQQRIAADQLHREMPIAEDAFGAFAYERKTERDIRDIGPGSAA